MSKKIKLLAVSDAACISTGFGRVASEVLDRLHATGDYDIKQMGINFFDEDHDKPYRIFSASGGGNSQLDWLGYKRIGQLYADLQPDVVWLFQDFWIIAQYLGIVPDMKGVVTYFPVDSPNIKSSWALFQSKACEVCTYTDFAAKELSKSVSFAFDKILESARDTDKDSLKTVNIPGPNGSVIPLSAEKLRDLTDPSNINVIPHGNDISVFNSVPKKVARKVFEFDNDWFIVGNVNRNQSRKRLDLTIKAFSEFANDKPNARLLFHDPIPAKEGWDLLQLAHEYYDVGDKILISNTHLDTETLNYLYNSLDVMVNSGGGEGWGLTSTEGACCGVPQIVPNWSATKEIWEGVGLLTDVISVRHEPGLINTAQCVIDTNHLSSQLQELYDSEDYRIKVGKQCKDKMLSQEYSWDIIADKFDEIFRRVAANPEVPFNQLDLGE